MKSVLPGASAVTTAGAIIGSTLFDVDGKTPLSIARLQFLLGIKTTLQAGSFSANPTAKVGLTPVDGVAPSFMTSDSAPELDVTISPVWTGVHSFTQMFAELGSGAAGQVLTLVGPSTPAWRTQTVSPGPQGEDGTDGMQGPPGLNGAAGAAGSMGAPGLSGEDGLDGLPGPVGPSGSAGAQGVAGALGPPGLAGEDGIDGLIGPTGPAGPIGVTGSPGVPGSPGVAGDDGADGNDGPPGPAGPTGATGATGGTGIQGPNGPAGLDGEDGPEGIPGAQGPAGVAGPTGAQGIQGPYGPLGMTGEDGADGNDGPMGPIGVTGPIGVQGIQGFIGPPGLWGDDGEGGDRGPPGPTGATGATGAQGPAGSGGGSAVALDFDDDNFEDYNPRALFNPAAPQTILAPWVFSGAGAVGAAGSPLNVSLTGAGAYGLNITPIGTASFPGLLVMDSTATRVLEVLYAGSTSAGVYGAAADAAVINAGPATSGGLVLSTSDLARILITATGITTIQGGAGATQPAAPLQVKTGAIGYAIVLTDGTGIGYLSFGSSHEIQFGSNTQGFDLISAGVLILQCAASGQINLSATANIIGGVTTGNAISINQGANTSPALAYTSTGTSGEALSCSWAGTGANLIISSDVFISNVAEIFCTTTDMWLGTQNVHNLILSTNLANRLSINGSTGLVTIAGALSVGTTISATGAIGENGSTPPAKLTGWGTPISSGVIANLPSSATVGQLSSAVGAIIQYLKSKGCFGV